MVVRSVVLPAVGGVLAILAAASPTAAKSPRDEMFPSESRCYARSYSKAHMAEHPAQRVTAIALTPDRGTDTDPLLRLWLKISVRGSAEVMEALSYCENEGGDTLYCGMEGDAGGFTLTPARNGAVLLTVSSLGVNLEGARGFVTLEHDRGDDRSFVLPQVDQCR